MGELGADGERVDVQGRLDTGSRSNGHANGHTKEDSGQSSDDAHVNLGDLGSASYVDDDAEASTALLATQHYGKLNTGGRLKMQQLYAMFIKRFIHSRRNKGAIIIQLLLPMVFVLIALIVAKTYPGPTDSPARELFSLTRSYDENTVLYTNVNASDANSTADSRRLSSNFLALISAEGAAQDSELIPTVGAEWNNVSRYILNRIGDRPQSVAKFNKVNLLALGFEPSSTAPQGLQPQAYFNGAAYHSVSQALAWMDASIIQAFRGGNVTDWSYSNSPLPRTSQERAQDEQDSMQGFYIAFTILFGMAFLASSFVLFLVTERSNKAKHIQFVSGVGPLSYWAASYAWDFINFLLPTAGCVILFLAFDVGAYSEDRLGMVVLLFILYGLAVLPLMYLCR